MLSETLPSASRYGKKPPVAAGEERKGSLCILPGKKTIRNTFHIREGSNNLEINTDLPAVAYGIKRHILRMRQVESDGLTCCDIRQCGFPAFFVSKLYLSRIVSQVSAEDMP